MLHLSAHVHRLWIVVCHLMVCPIHVSRGILRKLGALGRLVFFALFDLLSFGKSVRLDLGLDFDRRSWRFRRDVIGWASQRAPFLVLILASCPSVWHVQYHGPFFCFFVGGGGSLFCFCFLRSTTGSRLPAHRRPAPTGSCAATSPSVWTISHGVLTLTQPHARCVMYFTTCNLPMPDAYRLPDWCFRSDVMTN